MLTRNGYDNDPKQRTLAETLERKFEEYRLPQVDVSATKASKWGNAFTVMARETAQQVFNYMT